MRAVSANILRFARIRALLAVFAAFGALAPSSPAAPDDCADAPAAWVFCTGFEEGDFALWDDWDGNPAPATTLVSDPGPHGVPGNSVARLWVAPGSGTADLTKVLPTGHDVLYARWYVKYENGFDFTTPQHGGGLHAGDRALLAHSGDRPEGDDWFAAFIEPGYNLGRLVAYSYYRGMYQNCVDPVGSCWGDQFPCTQDDGASICTDPAHRETVLPPLMESGRWYSIEVMLDGGTPSADGSVRDGVLSFWIDGIEIGPWRNLWLRTTDQLKLDVLWLSLYFHGDHGPQGVLYDDVVVSTEPIGPRAPSTADEDAAWGSVKGIFR